MQKKMQKKKNLLFLITQPGVYNTGSLSKIMSDSIEVCELQRGLLYVFAGLGANQRHFEVHD